MPTEKNEKSVITPLVEELKFPEYRYQAIDHSLGSSTSLSSTNKPAVDDEVAKKSKSNT